MAGEAGHHGDVGIHGVADGHALALEGVVVVGHPVPRFLGVHEGEGEGADAELRGQVDRLAIRARHPDGWMRLLHGLGKDVARRHGEVLSGEAGVRIHHQHVRDLLDALAPHGAPLGRVDAEAFQLGARRGLAGAPVDAAARHEVERGEALRHPRGRVVAGRHEDDAVAETDAP
jgi:hypothetical protein